MEEKDFLTVPEYAALKGITKQAVYKSLREGSLRPFAVDVYIDGRKSRAISKEALEDDRPRGRQWRTVSSNVENCRDYVGAEQEKSRKKSNAEDRLLELLENQLAEKDKLIAELQKSVAEKDKFIIDQGQKITDLLAVSQELQRNSQYLLRLANGEADTPPAESQEEKTAAEQNAAENATPPAAEPQKENVGFWKRLFRG